MSKTREWLIFALLAGLLLPVGKSQAGLLDLFSTKSKPSLSKRCAVARSRVRNRNGQPSSLDAAGLRRRVSG